MCVRCHWYGIIDNIQVQVRCTCHIQYRTRGAGGRLRSRLTVGVADRRVRRAHQLLQLSKKAAATSFAAITRPIAWGVWAPAVRHLTQHALCRRQKAWMHPVVALNVAPRDGFRVAPIRQRMVIAEHLAWARGRVRPLHDLDTLARGARVVRERERRGRVEPPRTLQGEAVMVQSGGRVGGGWGEEEEG